MRRQYLEQRRRKDRDGETDIERPTVIKSERQVESGRDRDKVGETETGIERQ